MVYQPDASTEPDPLRFPLKSKTSTATFGNEVPSTLMTLPLMPPPVTRTKSIPVAVFWAVTAIGVPAARLHEPAGQGTSLYSSSR